MALKGETAKTVILQVPRSCPQIRSTWTEISGLNLFKYILAILFRRWNSPKIVMNEVFQTSNDSGLWRFVTKWGIFQAFPNQSDWSKFPEASRMAHIGLKILTARLPGYKVLFTTTVSLTMHYKHVINHSWRMKLQTIYNTDRRTAHSPLLLVLQATLASCDSMIKQWSSKHEFTKSWSCYCSHNHSHL